MNLGKTLRLKNFFRHGPNTILVPLDHGITLGPIKGIESIAGTIDSLSKLTIDGIILHKGIITSCSDTIIKSDIPLIMHLSANTNLSKECTKILVGNVREALSLGASAVSVHINFGTPNEVIMLRDVAYISEECFKYGMPLLTMAYHSNNNAETISHIARACSELGADLIKVPPTKKGEDFSKVVSGCPVPLIISGGEFDSNINNIISNAVSCGARGVAIGRNLFQSDDIKNAFEDIQKIVRK